MTALSETYARFDVAFDYSRLTAGMRQVETANRQVNRIDRERRSKGGTASPFGGAGAAIGGWVTAGLAAVSTISRVTSGVRSLITEQTRLAANLDDTSQRIGINATDLQAWRLAANQAGIESGELDAAFTRLSGQLGRRGSTADKALRALGVSTRGANGEVRDLGEILGEAADPLARLGTAERNARLVALLGRSGARLGPLFAQGAAGIQQAREQLQLLGGGISKQARENLAAFDDATGRLDVALTSVKSTIAGALAPILRQAVDIFSRVAGVISNIARNSHLVNRAILAIKVALIALALITAPVWVPMLILTGLLLVALGAIYFLIDDIITAFEGGRSVSAAFWNSIVQGVEDAINAVRAAFGGDAIRLGARFANGGQGTTGGFSASASERAERAIKTVPKARGSEQINVTHNNSPTIHVTSQATPEQIERVVDRSMERRNRNAVEALSTAGGPILDAPF